MYYKNKIKEFVKFIEENNGIANKAKLEQLVQDKFSLICDRSVYYCQYFAVRFCKAKSRNFGNTVLSLSALQKYDTVPFIVCLVTPKTNYLMLANTTFLKKISHSSQDLRVDNIRGSFNGSDILKRFEGIENIPHHFEYLFTSHENFSFDENLERLVEATNDIVPTGKRFTPNVKQKAYIYESVKRAISFMEAEEYKILERDLSNRVASVSGEIAIAAFIDNVNLRGRIIEFLITAPNNLKTTLIDALHNKKPLPNLFTSDSLGDYQKTFDFFYTETDIKTKIMFLSSNPKGYNIDKLLAFLSEKRSVYLIYVVGIDENQNIETVLCSMFNDQLLNGTRIIKHWAGRNSRGVTQYTGASLESLLNNFDNKIDVKKSLEFLDECLNN